MVFISRVTSAPFSAAVAPVLSLFPGPTGGRATAFCALILLLLVSLITPHAEAARLYRFKNADGVWVISSSIPSDRVALGYEIVDETGRTVKEVAPQPSPEEAAAYLARRQAAQEREEAIRRIDLLYGSERDIEYALQKALRSIDTSIAHTQANILQLRSQRQRLEEQAARIERAGNEISDSLAGSIAALDAQIRTLTAEIENRQQQKDVERERHARDRLLFLEVYGADASAS